jgi:hypothetical protein
MRALYIRLRPQELEELGEAAADERRSPQEQAAQFVAEGLARRRATRQIAAELPSFDPDLLFEGNAA